MLAQQTFPTSSSRNTFRAFYDPSREDANVRLAFNSYHLAALVERLSAAKTVFLDTEATSLDTVNATPLLLQLLWEEHAYVLVLPAFGVEEMRPLFQALANKLIVGHNLNYDYKLLRSHYLDVRFGAVYDTQLAEQLLTGGEEENKKNWLARVSLKSLAKKYAHFELDKEERDTFTQQAAITSGWRPSVAQVEYAADDVFILRPVMAAQLDRLMEEGLWRAATLRFGALVPLADMELRGMRVDAVAWREYLAALGPEKTEAETQLRTLLTLNEHKWRQQQYEKAKREKEEWERERDRAEAGARDRWVYDSEHGHMTDAWGKFKVRYMQEWREDHPNPGTPKLDTEPINLTSPIQMQRAYKFLGLEMESLDAKHRERLLERMDLTPEQRSVVECHTRYSQLNTICTRYGESLLAMLDANSRLHGHFNIGLTGTGRMSSENPNFQNFPKDERIRRAFIADEGTVVLTADYSGQELAIAAALSRDERMKADINAGKDLYKGLAVEVWGGTLEDVTKEQRQMAKAAVLGIIYGQGPKGLVNRYGMPETLAKTLIAHLKKMYGRLTRWGDHQAELASTKGYVTTISGARRRFPHAEEMGWKLGTESRNAPIQGSAADVVYRLVWRLKQVEHTGLVAVNIIHDEAVCLAPADRPAYFVSLLEEEMMQAFYDLFPFDKYGVKAGVETHVASYWSKEKTTIAQVA